MYAEQQAAFVALEGLATELSKQVDVEEFSDLKGGKYVDKFNDAIAFVVLGRKGLHVIIGYANGKYVCGMTDLSRGHEYLVLTEPSKWKGVTSDTCLTTKEILDFLVIKRKAITTGAWL